MGKTIENGSVHDEKFTKALFLLLALTSLLLTVPMVSAADILASGTCGEDLTWVLTADGALRITGTGPMANYDTSDEGHAPWYSRNSDIKTVELYAGVTTIGDCAFSFCNSLTDVKIPEGVTTIGNSAFFWCDGLTSVTLPESVTTIHAGAFSCCHRLTSIVIPEGVTTIAASTFSYCSSLREVTIPASVATINSYAFEACVSLTEMTIPEGVTAIANAAFCSCEKLTSVTIPSSVTKISASTFQDCSSLSSVTIPKRVTSIGAWAFLNCGSLSDIYYDGTKADWANISIGGENDSLLKATLHALCEGASVHAVYTNDGDGTHTVVKSCSLCGDGMGTDAEACKDQDLDGLCDSCKAVVVTHKPADYEVLSLILLDGGGKKLDSIPTGSFYAEATVKKNREADPVLAMIVTYTEDGQMLQTTFLRANVPGGSTYSIGTWIPNTDSKVEEVKVFLLSSLGNPVPVCAAASVK